MVNQPKYEIVPGTKSVIRIGDKQTYMDGLLIKNLTDLWKDVRKDDDGLIIVDGKERIGKSVLAMTIAWFLSEGKLTLDHVCLTPEEFREAVATANKYDVIIFDEAYLGFASTDSMMKYNRLLKRMLVTCGERNLIFILVLPSVFDLSKYAVLHRSDFLLHCYKYKGERGRFTFFNSRRLKSLYVTGKKFYSYRLPSSNFSGTFPNKYFVPEDLYRTKKRKATDRLLQDSEDSDIGKKTQVMYNAIKYIYKLEPKTNKKELAKELGCSDRTIYTAIKTNILQIHI